MEGDRWETAVREDHPDGGEGPGRPQAGEAEASQREAAYRPDGGSVALQLAEDPEDPEERLRRSEEQERTRPRRRQRTKSPRKYGKVMVS